MAGDVAVTGRPHLHPGPVQAGDGEGLAQPAGVAADGHDLQATSDGLRQDELSLVAVGTVDGDSHGGPCFPLSVASHRRKGQGDF
ncbi:hypothetical protein GCM10017559_69700 [Streptosporangium longisporum]|uniref:Uncharacterized protein n=1 Tax=Streptosporangium longisporum TaxID=46187 RepID=A0ABP6L6U6_9ACTN